MSPVLLSMQRSSNKGFTLVETMAVVGILSVVGLALSSMVTYFYKANAYTLEQASAVQSARRGLTTTLTNIREASYGDDGSYPISAAATSSITFYADIDGDASIEKVRIYAAGGSLYRGITNSGGSPRTYVGQSEAIDDLAPYLRNAPTTPIFTYYNSEGVALTYPINVSSVTAVGIHLTVDINPNRAPNLFTLTGDATLRNLRTY